MKEPIMRYLRLLTGPSLLILIAGVAGASKLDPEAVLNLKSLEPRGARYEATVPDTLDLAERARLSVNYLTNNVESTQFYCVYQLSSFGSNPPVRDALTWMLPGKNLFALPYMRTMCGSEQNLNIELEIMRAHLKQIAENGLMYFPIDKGVPKDTSYPLRSAMVALAILNWHERDGNPAWLDWFQRICQGLRKVAVQVQDRAFYPPECGIDRQGKWHWSTRGKPVTPYTPPNEPVTDNQGVQGAVEVSAVTGHPGPGQML